MNRILAKIAALLGGLFSFFIGDITLPLQILAGFIVLELLTGVGKVLFGGVKFDKVKARHGAGKILFMFVGVSLGHLMDMILPIEFAIAMNSAIGFYLWEIGSSILNNFADAKYPYPQGFKNLLEKFKSEGD